MNVGALSTSGGSLSGNLGISKNIYLNSSSGEQAIFFESCDTSKATIYFYKGAPGSSSTGIGLWDSTNSRGVWRYDPLSNIFAVVSTLSTSSDRNLKKDIEPIPFDIVDKLEPVQFRMKDESDERIRYGFIAQDVETALVDAGVDVDSSSLVTYKIDENGNKSDYTLAYLEFIPLLVKKLQNMQKQIDKLQAKVETLEQMLEGCE